MEVKVTDFDPEKFGTRMNVHLTPVGGGGGEPVSNTDFGRMIHEAGQAQLFYDEANDRQGVIIDGEAYYTGPHEIYFKGESNEEKIANRDSLHQSRDTIDIPQIQPQPAQPGPAEAAAAAVSHTLAPEAAHAADQLETIDVDAPRMEEARGPAPQAGQQQQQTGPEAGREEGPGSVTAAAIGAVSLDEASRYDWGNQAFGMLERFAVVTGLIGFFSQAGGGNFMEVLQDMIGEAQAQQQFEAAAPEQLAEAAGPGAATFNTGDLQEPIIVKTDDGSDYVITDEIDQFAVAPDEGGGFNIAYQNNDGELVTSHVAEADDFGVNEQMVMDGIENAPAPDVDPNLQAAMQMERNPAADMATQMPGPGGPG